MKIQGLAIIFIIIILPITIVIGEYAATQISLFRTEQLYDSRLITATYDSLKAFQINTFNDATSDISDSKIDSIENAVNAFYNSMEVGFGLEGYSKEDLQSYIPALVYTMYDGYYIYSPYTNVAKITEVEDTNTSNDLDEEYKEKELTINLDSNEIKYGLKPYVYYSCRYVYGNIDVVINYSLDNYIAVQGTIDGKSIYKSGYLLTIATSKNSEGVYFDETTKKWYYSGIEITEEEYLTDILVETDGTTNEYAYVKLNGTKYYLNNKDDDGDGIIDEYIFSIMGENRIKQASKSSDEKTYNKYLNLIKSNSSAKSYYRDAYEFTKWVNANLNSLKPEHAQVDDSQQLKRTSTGTIFDNEQIEYPGSNFNLHKKEVIRYSIESNLSVAIANFNEYTGSSNNFQMPKLTESEWELLENEISIISFLQGLNMGGKIYNGYTVVTNNKTEEVVKEERIYICVDENGDYQTDYYHKINDKHLTKEFVDNLADDDLLLGALDLDFEIRKDGATGNSYIQKSGLACYTSIVGQENLNNKYDSIYEYLQSLDQTDAVIKKTKKLYYTALARERWSTYKYEDIENVIEQMWPMNDYDIVTDGLIRFYDAANIDGDGNTGNSSTTVWQDLSGHHDAEIVGATANTNGYVTFDGKNDWMNCGVVDVENVTFDVNVCLKDYPVSGHDYIIGNWETNRAGAGLYIDKNGKVYFALYDENHNDKNIKSTTSLELDEVYNIVATYDGKVMKLYIDGVCEKTLDVNSKIAALEENTILAMGANPKGDVLDSWTTYMNMNIYSVIVYDRALTSEEIEQNYKEMKKIGGGSSQSGEDIVIPDTTPPTVTANPVSAIECSSTNVTITLADLGESGLSSTTGQYYLSTSSTELSGGSWQSYTSGLEFTIGEGLNGTYYLFINTVTDNDGNVSTENGSIVTIDGTNYHQFGPYKFKNLEIITAATLYAMTEDEKAEIYGGYVTNYTAINATNDELGIGGWRIFHSDGENIYLIADNYIETQYVPKGKRGTGFDTDDGYLRAFSLDQYKDYAGWSDISSSIVATKWLSQYAALGQASTYYNMKATAYLLDTNQWSEFSNSSYANYAIGGPTLELFADSYNVLHDTDIDTKYTTGSGYQVKWSTSDSYNYIELSTEESLYVISSDVNAYGMWIASPSIDGEEQMMFVKFTGSLCGNDYAEMSPGARPVVSLKSNIKLEKQSDGTYLIIE